MNMPLDSSTFSDAPRSVPPDFGLEASITEPITRVICSMAIATNRQHAAISVFIEALCGRLPDDIAERFLADPFSIAGSPEHDAFMRENADFYATRLPLQRDQIAA